MNVFFVRLWTTVGTSYWFVPSLMVIGALLLSFVTTVIDSRIGSEWMDDIDWLYANRPDGARAVLSTVAGSMITVAGVTFSMTILSISQTTSQVGPRLMNNFMGDKANQVTLGVFISTFIYCLMVLRTVRNAEAASPGSTASSDLASAFVPHVAVIVGVLMALVSVGVLIFFVHHIPESMHVSNIIAGVGRGLNRQIESQFPARVGDPHQSEASQSVESELADSFYATAKTIYSTGTGYLEYIDGEELMQLAKKHDLVLKIRPTPGDFVTEESVLLLASPMDRIDHGLKAKLSAMFVRGAQRNATQDLRFQVNQLVEVAMRALSPGVNDPFTATNCMDWLQSALENLAARKLPDAHRYDDEQRLRVVAEPVAFDSFASLVFDQLRPYVVTDRTAALKMMEMIGNLVVVLESKGERRLLVRHACALRRECQVALVGHRTHNSLGALYREVLRLFVDEAHRARAKRSGDWVPRLERDMH